MKKLLTKSKRRDFDYMIKQTFEFWGFEGKFYLVKRHYVKILGIWFLIPGRIYKVERKVRITQEGNDFYINILK